MKENVLLKYMNRISVHQAEKTNRRHGPVITISREYGCYAGEIAEKLALKLTEYNKLNSCKDEWLWLNKEIIESAAKKLQVNPEQIQHIFKGEPTQFLGDLIISFSRSYTSDEVIKKTITNVVKNYAEAGNAVIVGRAGCVIAKHIQNALHIKLIAPLDWRAQNIGERYNLSPIEARKRVEERDRKRTNFMEFFKGNLPDSKLFHVIYNRDKLTTDEIIEQIMLLAKLKKIC